MKLVVIKCPNCHADVEVNKELEEAVCNYCGNRFLIEDEKETKEERIIKAISKKEEKDREYYASEDYKKKLTYEKSGKLSAFINNLDELANKNREYLNSEEYHTRTKRTLKTLGIIYGVIIVVCGLFVIVGISLGNKAPRTITCTLNDKEYVVSVKKDESIKCATCDDKTLKELNDKCLDKDDLNLTEKNIQAYFKNLGGTCE